MSKKQPDLHLFTTGAHAKQLIEAGLSHKDAADGHTDNRWALTELLDMLPKSIRLKNRQFEEHVALDICKALDNWVIEYSYDDVDNYYCEKRYTESNLIDAAVKMVIWVQKNYPKTLNIKTEQYQTIKNNNQNNQSNEPK